MSSQQVSRGTSHLCFVLLLLPLLGAGLILGLQPQYLLLAGVLMYAITTVAITSNDFPQVFATYLESSRWSWWLQWLLFSGVLWLVHAQDWFVHSTIHFGKLDRIPEVSVFTWVQILTPFWVILATRFKFPLSTSFAVLTTFSFSLSQGTEVVEGMIMKSLNGYWVAYLAACLVWLLVIGGSRWSLFQRVAQWRLFCWLHYRPFWVLAQTVTTALLWSAWLKHDTANAAVFLPRELSTPVFIVAVGIYTICLGIILYRRGGEMQDAVREHSPIEGPASATLIDLVYFLILMGFSSGLPMSTTFVFFGLIGGRHMMLTASRSESTKVALLLALKYFVKALLAMCIALALAWIGALLAA